MNIRKKFTLALLYSIGATVALFMDIKAPELMAYGALSAGVLSAFGYMDVKGKEFER